jgi:RNA polymerase sigma-70 factor (ECF subfamily)
MGYHGVNPEDDEVPLELVRLRRLDSLAELSDEDVMERCATGSEIAFRALVKRYRSRIMNLVSRFINDRDRAEEISQEVFLRVFRNRERYRKSGKFSTWIFTIAVNLTKNEIRSRVRHKGTFSLDALEEETGGQGLPFPDTSPLPDEDLSRGEIREKVAEALRKLPPRYREAVVLRDVEGMSYEEVGQILGIPGGTVRSRINRARLMLKERLRPFLTLEDL